MKRKALQPQGASRGWRSQAISHCEGPQPHGVKYWLAMIAEQAVALTAASALRLVGR